MTDDLTEALILGDRAYTHPFGIAALVIGCAVILFGRRPQVIFGVLIFIFAIPSAQRIVIFSLDFSFLRIVILITIFRAFVKGDHATWKITGPDKILFWWAIWGIVAYGFLLENFGAVLTRTGFMVDAVGSYLVGRIYMSTWGEIKRVIVFLGWMAFPILVFFLVERATGRNMFSVFGGINEITLVREGKLRCQGPFSHPIMAGAFWASVLLWFAALWQRKETSRFVLILMTTAVMLIIINTASSTPVMAVLLGATGVLYFRYRNTLTAVRWIALFTLIAAQILMEKGAAHLLARVNILAGSTGWHRYHLIDEWMKHFGEWWLFGTRSTGHWGLGLEDVTNQFVLESVRGGVVGFILFSMFLISLFGLIGRGIKASENSEEKFILWCGGVVLFVHTFSFISVSYFGQMVASFFLFSGAIASLSMAHISRTATENGKATKNKQAVPF
jgi:hypothetical protein